MKSGRFLAKYYGINVRSAYAHNLGDWYWNLTAFPGVYFDSEGCLEFETEATYRHCLYLSIGPRNTSVRNRNLGLSISDIPGYRKLNPPPRTW